MNMKYQIPKHLWPITAFLSASALISIAPGCEDKTEKSPGGSREQEKRMESASAPKTARTHEKPVFHIPSPYLPETDEAGFEIFVEDSLRLPHLEDSSVDLLSLGQEALDRGDTAGALEAYRKEAFSSDSYAAYFGIARAARLAKDYDLAIEALAVAAKADPNLAEPLIMAARICLETGETDIGLNYINRAIAREPERADAHNVRGRLWSSKEQYHRALLSFKRSVKLDPGFVWAWNNKGYIHLVTGNYEEAVNALENATALAPSTAYMQNNLGLAYKKSGRLEEAASAFKEAITIRPGYVNAIINSNKLDELKTAIASVESRPAFGHDESTDPVPGG